MAATIKGPGIFLAQFTGDAAPFDTLGAICGWAAGPGYKGAQIPTFIARHIIRTTDRAFDDVAGAPADQAKNRRLLGL